MTAMTKLSLIIIGLGLVMKSQPKQVRVATQTQKWSGAGTDPFGTSYTVPGRAQRGGL